MVCTMVATPALRQAQEGTLGHLAEQVLAMKWVRQRSGSWCGGRVVEGVGVAVEQVQIDKPVRPNRRMVLVLRKTIQERLQRQEQGLENCHVSVTGRTHATHSPHWLG